MGLDPKKDGRFDATLAFLNDPYRFISRECRKQGVDVFQTNLLLGPTVCMTGSAAAQLFYDENRFVRSGAAPLRLQWTIFGRGGVQTLDGSEHRVRKEMFTTLLSPARVERLLNLTRQQWEACVTRWSRERQVVFYPHVQEVLSRAVCEWVGVPLPESDVHLRTKQLVAMFDRAGAIGPKHWWARFSRFRADNWIESIVQDVRAGKLSAPSGSILEGISLQQDASGRLLPARTAAVEILNVLRPVVAVSVYLTFAVLAIQQYPAVGETLRQGRDEEAEHFAWEVRRFYPFFPAIAAIVRNDFEWQGIAFKKGTRALLDVYGTNHDVRDWHEPDTFQPERFSDTHMTPFNFIPQGGGDAPTGHRCPGEHIADELIQQTARLFAEEIDYDLPPQDVSIDFGRIPALPKSKLLLQRVRLRSKVGMA